jgi:hypothetical protein
MRRTKQAPQRIARVLAALRSGVGIVAACRLGKVGYSTWYEWIREDAELRAEHDKALEQGEETRLEKFERRGIEGWDKPVWHKGRQVGVEKQFSDQAAMFSFQARNARRFNQRLQIEHGGVGGGPIQVVQKVFVVQGQVPTGGQVIDAEAVEVMPATEPAQLPSPEPDGPPVVVKRREFKL